MSNKTDAVIIALIHSVNQKVTVRENNHEVQNTTVVVAISTDLIVLH